jgi:hypothetical protein
MYHVKWESWDGRIIKEYSSNWKWLAIRKFKKLAFGSETVCRWFLYQDDRVLVDLCKVRFWKTDSVKRNEL